MRHHPHLSDRDLVLALDGELPVRRQAAVNAHLTECVSCRTRRTQLDQGGQLAAALHRSSVHDAEGVETTREVLRMKLADLARRREGSFVGRVASPFMRWAVVGAAAAAAASLVVVRQQREFRPLPPASVSMESDALPVASLTPGATWNLTADELCSSNGREERPVSDVIRAEVVHGYGMDRVPPDEYELDYLITPELGGAPAAQNLWPQRYASRTWNALVKDQLERLLPRLVCDGTISLQTAQRDIAVDWIAAYKRYFRTQVPLQTYGSLGTGTLMVREDDSVTYPVGRSGEAPALRLISFAASR